MTPTIITKLLVRPATVDAVAVLGQAINALLAGLINLIFFSLEFFLQAVHSLLILGFDLGLILLSKITRSPASRGIGNLLLHGLLLLLKAVIESALLHLKLVFGILLQASSFFLDLFFTAVIGARSRTGPRRALAKTVAYTIG